MVTGRSVYFGSQVGCLTFHLSSDFPPHQKVIPPACVSRTTIQLSPAIPAQSCPWNVEYGAEFNASCCACAATGTIADAAIAATATDTLFMKTMYFPSFMASPPEEWRIISELRPRFTLHRAQLARKRRGELVDALQLHLEVRLLLSFLSGIPCPIRGGASWYSDHVPPCDYGRQLRAILNRWFSLF